MPRKKQATAEAPATELVGGIVSDVETLLRQHLDLFRQDIAEQLGRVQGAAVSAGAGTGLIALGGVLTVEMAVHLVHRTTRLPLWASYGLVGGLLAGAGAGLLARAKQQASALTLNPAPQTTAAVREDVEWLQRETSAGPA